MADSKLNLEDISEEGRLVAAGLLPDPETSRRAFISAPPSVDTSVLRDVLQERGIVSYELDEVGGEGRRLPDLLEDCLDQTDLVVAMITHPDTDHGGLSLRLEGEVLPLIQPLFQGGAEA